MISLLVLSYILWTVLSESLVGATHVLGLGFRRESSEACCKRVFGGLQGSEFKVWDLGFRV